MAYNNGLLNFGDSIVEVGYNNENYSVDKAQIVEKDGTVHELGGGGGGGDYPTITATWHEDTQKYTYTCNKEYSYIRNILESWIGGGVGLAGIYIENGMDGSLGATWTTEDGALLFTRTDSTELEYFPDGTIAEG